MFHFPRFKNMKNIWMSLLPPMILKAGAKQILAWIISFLSYLCFAFTSTSVKLYSWWCLPFILCFPEQNDNTSYILMRKKRRTRRPCLSGLSEHLLPTKGLVISRLALPFLPGLLSHSYYAPIKCWKWCFPERSKITISFFTWFNWLGFRDVVKNYLANFFR